MTSLERSLIRVAEFLQSREIPYMVIGGVANLFLGSPRTTLDIDVTVQAESKEIKALVDEVRPLFRIRVEKPIAFIGKTRVLPLEDPDGVRIDLIFAALPYEIQAIKRARDFRVGCVPVKVCSPEDLVAHKIISDRPRDREDVAGIISRLRANLDRKYLDPLVKQLAEALTKPEILAFYLRCLHAKKVKK